MRKKNLSYILIALPLLLTGCLDSSDDNNQSANEKSGSTPKENNHSVAKAFVPENLDSGEFSQVIYQAAQTHLQVKYLLDELPYIEWGLSEDFRHTINSAVEAGQVFQSNLPIDCYNNGQGKAKVDMSSDGIGSMKLSYNNCEIPLKYSDGATFSDLSALTGKVIRDFIKISEEQILHKTKYNIEISDSKMHLEINGKAQFEKSLEYDRDTWKETSINIGSAKINSLNSEWQDSLDRSKEYNRGQYNLFLEDWKYSFEVDFLNDSNSNLLELSTDNFSQSFIGSLHGSFQLQGYCNLPSTQLSELQSAIISCH